MPLYLCPSEPLIRTYENISRDRKLKVLNSISYSALTQISTNCLTFAVCSSPTHVPVA